MDEDDATKLPVNFTHVQICSHQENFRENLRENLRKNLRESQSLEEPQSLQVHYQCQPLDGAMTVALSMFFISLNE